MSRKSLVVFDRRAIFRVEFERGTRYVFLVVLGSILLLRLLPRTGHTFAAIHRPICHLSTDVQISTVSYFSFLLFLDRLPTVISREPTSSYRLFPANTTRLITTLDASQWKSVDGNYRHSVASPRSMGVSCVISCRFDVVLFRLFVNSIVSMVHYLYCLCREYFYNAIAIIVRSCFFLLFFSLLFFFTLI